MLLPTQFGRARMSSVPLMLLAFVDRACVLLKAGLSLC
jgi:hypothetical protein